MGAKVFGFCISPVFCISRSINYYAKSLKKFDSGSLPLLSNPGFAHLRLRLEINLDIVSQVFVTNLHINVVRGRIGKVGKEGSEVLSRI